jgi:N-acetylmuramoyl-L-alanine amidase
MLVLALALMLVIVRAPAAHAASPVLYQGMTGSAVTELQSRLQQLGYVLDVDGAFGPRTAYVVTVFQQSHGLTVDGVVGPQTWGAIYADVNGTPANGQTTSAASGLYTVRAGDTLWGIANNNGTTVDELMRTNGLTSSAIYPGQQLRLSQAASNRGSIPISRSDYDLMARLVTAEAGGEPYEGQVAVAAVVLNRVKSPLFPNTIPEVIYQQYQFEPVQNGAINNPASDSAFKAVTDAVNGWDPSYGALFFYNPAKVSQSWMAARTTTVVIGNHVFSK